MPLRHLSKRVLVVDDNRTQREILAELLTAWGLVPVLAASSEEAVSQLMAAIAEQKPFALALIDTLMTNESGLELVEELRTRWTPIDLPVVLMSAEVKPIAPETAHLLGVANTIGKPFKESQLIKELRDALDGKLAEGRSGSGHYPRRNLPVARWKTPLGRRQLGESKVSHCLTSTGGATSVTIVGDGQAAWMLLKRSLSI